MRRVGSGIREGTRLGTEIKIQGVQEATNQRHQIEGIDRVVVRASADFVNKQEYITADDKKSFKLRVLPQKENT